MNKLKMKTSWRNDVCKCSWQKYDHQWMIGVWARRTDGPIWTGAYQQAVWIASIKMHHYNGVIMGAMASQITSLAIVYSTVYSGADQRKHQSSAPLAFVWRIHWWPVNSPHKWPVMRKMIPFDDVIMIKIHEDPQNRYDLPGLRAAKVIFALAWTGGPLQRN